MQACRCKFEKGEKMRKLLLVLSLFALGCATYFVAPAGANAPVKTSFSGSGSFPVNDLCPFVLIFSCVNQIDETTFSDNAGNITMIHDKITEQDTYTANGKTLTGDRYHANADTYFDNGVVTKVVAEGVIERVHLPAGGVFTVAGRIDPFNGLAFAPDHGTAGNIDGFCTALSP
jgi:hypothetical protein